jgi:dipeptidyl aminopeptidase/acylaminoacyl peptidase
MRRDLEHVSLPEAEDAERRAWQLVARAYEERTPHAHTGPSWRRATIVVAVATGALVVVAVSLAAPSLVRSVRQAVGLRTAAPALTQLPTSGRLLVSSVEGPWIVQQDGSKRLLGDYQQASWSPHGLFVAVTTAHQLFAVDPHGTVRWSIARAGPIGLPRWSPDGYRIAYFDGIRLRIVNGDGTGDHAVPGAVAHVAAAWRPTAGHDHTLAYALVFTVHGRKQVRLVVENIDTHQFDADERLPAVPSTLVWSTDGQRLVAVTPHTLSIFNHNGKPVGTIPLPRSPVDAAFAPRGHRLAVIVAGGRDTTFVYDIDDPGRVGQQVFTGGGRFTGVAWSPDGDWLLLAWRSADQWLFIRLAPQQQIKAVSAIAAQFNPGRRKLSFPVLNGWCCTP